MNYQASATDIVKDLDMTLRAIKCAMSRGTIEAIRNFNRDTEEGQNAIIGIATNMGWVWGGYHWYTTKSLYV
jgi:hypothetical protein